MRWFAWNPFVQQGIAFGKRAGVIELRSVGRRTHPIGLTLLHVAGEVEFSDGSR